MLLYLDNCCYNRPFDDQTQDKIRHEAEAIQNIIKLAQWYGHTILASRALEIEIGEINNPVKHRDVLNLYRQSITGTAYYRKATFDYVRPLAVAAGVKGLDVHHLAFAAASGADYLLTTDENFIKAAAGLKLSVKVINPSNFPMGGMIWQ